MKKIKHRFLDIVLGGLCILPFLSTGIEGISPTVNLTVERGVSLVGEHCPGTIRLLCEGVDLTTLRWRYNGDNVIYSFSTTDLPMNSVTTNPAFINVELKFVASTPNDKRFGNFVSVLTADIAQLQSQNVGNINCGDPGTIDTEPVNIRILQPSIPITPRVSSVVATYLFGALQTIDVSWIKLEEDCPEFAATLVYELRLTGVQSHQSHQSLTANQTSCRSELCDESFSLNVSGKRVNVTGYNLSLRARNNIGSSEAFMYQLKQQSDQYFSTEINATNCPSLRTQCVSEDSNLRNATCSVSYGTDPTFMDLPYNMDSPFDIPFPITAGLSSNTTFFLAYSTPVPGYAIILIVIRETLTTDVCEHGPNTASIVAPIATVLVIILIIMILLFIIGVVLCCVRKYRKKNKSSINRFEEDTEFVKPQTELVKLQTDEATYNSTETCNYAPPLSKAVQDKDAEQEPKYWFSLGPLKFGRSEDTTPIGACGAPVTSPVVLVPPGQTDLSAGSNRLDEENGQTDLVKPQTDEAMYDSSESNNAPPLSKGVQDKDAKQEPKYRFSLGPLKFGRSEDTTSICGASVTSPVVTPGQTDLSAGSSANRPKEENRQTEFVKPQTTYSTSDATPLSMALPDEDLKQEPKYRISLGPLKFRRSEDTTVTLIGCALVTSPVVPPGQTDLPAGNSINRPDEKNGQTEVVKPQTGEATYNSSETSNAPPFSEAVQDKDAKLEPKYRFSLGPLKFGWSEDTTPIGCAPVTSPVNDDSFKILTLSESMQFKIL